MNHGARAHAVWQDDRYVPITFYNELDTGRIVEDVQCGHDTLTDVTGQAPIGFRAPHFGSFQSEDDLALIYRTIKPLGYRMPRRPFRRGAWHTGRL